MIKSVLIDSIQNHPDLEEPFRNSYDISRVEGYTLRQLHWDFLISTCAPHKCFACIRAVCISASNGDCVLNGQACLIRILATIADFSRDEEGPVIQHGDGDFWIFQIALAVACHNSSLKLVYRLSRCLYGANEGKVDLPIIPDQELA